MITEDEVVKAALLLAIDQSVRENPCSAADCMLHTGLSKEVSSTISYQRRVRRWNKSFNLTTVLATAFYRNPQFFELYIVKSALVRRLVPSWSCEDCLKYAGVCSTLAQSPGIQDTVLMHAESFHYSEMLEYVYAAKRFKDSQTWSREHGYETKRGSDAVPAQPLPLKSTTRSSSFIAVASTSASDSMDSYKENAVPMEAGKSLEKVDGNGSNSVKQPVLKRVFAKVEA